MKTLLSLAVIVGSLAFFWHIGGWHLRHQPTADKLYGCTVAQQAPNGDCK